MRLARHLNLLVQGTVVWAGFWVAGLPGYYQQYSQVTIGVASVLISVLISLAAVFLLVRIRPELRVSRAFWLSVYYTLPFVVFDTLYCGVYLGHGAGYLVHYWYLSIFYVTPWITFLPTALLLRGQRDS